ncbi:SDR family NAD(P)-dependent oxidoreductase [Streptomyces sp. NPDC048603]|uniref:SDR family NAD(P)-dependent oxidoreductase n=1 Tax=Streptomyces sp. NPDC048603 TaxID=3365577 RepID=UPI00371C7388
MTCDPAMPHVTQPQGASVTRQSASPAPPTPPVRPARPARPAPPEPPEPPAPSASPAPPAPPLPSRPASSEQPVGAVRAVRPAARDRVVALSPFEEPNPRIVVAAERAGCLGLLDLGRDAAAARRALSEVARRLPARRFGVRVPPGCPLGPEDLPSAVDTVLLADPGVFAPAWIGAWAGAGSGSAEGSGDGRGDDRTDDRTDRRGDGRGGGRRVWAEVTGVAEAGAAVSAGVAALVAKGHEAGGRVGGDTVFVLLQRLLADPATSVPVLAQGGIGPHTAAAALAGGAAGVLLDVQLALTAEGEEDLPGEVAAALRAMDGSETRVRDGHRVYVRPGLAPPEGAVAGLLGARSLREQLLPVGQDGAFAARLARRHRTTGALLRAVRTASAGHLEAVVRADPLRPVTDGGPLPVAQGPMTRVSDQAAFAEAVADGGAVPYLALAVMEGPAVRKLLAETAGRLAGRPWGVGLLGFAPPELRREQLAAVAEVRPAYAIIAGGTPAQAAPLEAAGTRTHLHVPSPGLLEHYLADGARRFVFEGLECGGHVGPRASFPLWEEQIERLLSCPDPAELDVLFAGGIHDARSAAMAATAAAPLAAAGARIGVLMGTAYLFTEEAVAAGAVLPGFQRAALECTDTVLLHTAPGHATRCADTPYAETFDETRRRLEETGTEPRRVWEELERLNLGRLRIASKGLRHGEDGRPVPVPEEVQRAEGLFMLGQAAALRSGVTTVSALHTEVTEGATALLERRARDLEPRSAPDGDTSPGAEGSACDIAIVGMACAFPGAPDLASYWAAVLDGTDAVTEVPAERWDPAVYYDPDPARAGERTPSRWGGFLPPIPFDALAHGIPPASLAGIEPVQLLALEISARALADAGYGYGTGAGKGTGAGTGPGTGAGAAEGREFDRSRTSVVFGAEAGTELAGAYGLRALHPAYLGELPPGLDEQLPRLTEDSFPGILANVIAGRVANRLDLGGANCTVDAACASSLAALDLACRQLRDGDSDMVLCGGADVHNGINDYLMFASVRALSPTGRCRPFDASADGIALGEGVGVLVLKRLADAERDGDRVYALIKSVGASSDGRSLGLTAPRPDGQRRALEQAYRRAGVAPRQVGLVEAHGTGTVVGDSTELGVLTALFEESGAAAGSCTLGSVKSQLGHTKCAAGLAGLIKAARAVHAGVRPPTLHLERPNAAWDRATSPFRFDAAARPWGVPAGRRYAGVSAFGFGGTNYHAVLAGYEGGDPLRHGLEAWPAEVFCFRGEDRRAAGRAMARLAARLEENDAAGRPWALRDLAAEAAAPGGSAGGAAAPVRVAVVAGGLDELAVRLERARAFEAGDGVYPAPAERGAAEQGTSDPVADAGADPVADPVADPGRVAFLFPGQGSQRPGMLGELFVAFPWLREELLDRAPEPVAAVASAVYPPAAFSAEDRAAQRAAVTDTRVAQPALGLAGAAAHLLLGALGVRPDCVAGHSYGELTALWAAGAYDTESLLRLSARRAEAILAAAGSDPGAMAAVAATPERAGPVAERHGCVVANHNAPRQCVISGPTEAVAAAVAELRAAGLSAEPLAVACAFHSGVVAGASTALAAELAGTAVADAAVPVWSNTTAGPYPEGARAIRELLARQVAEPVRFVEQVEAMYAAGVRTFVEAGPGRVLSGLVRKILGDRPHTVVPLDVPGEHGLARLVTAVAELVAAGVPVDPEPLFRGRAVPLPERAPRRPGWLVDGHLVRTTDGAPVPGGLRPASRVAPVPGGTPSPAPEVTPRPAAGPPLREAPARAAAPAGLMSAAPSAAPAPAGAGPDAAWGGGTGRDPVALPRSPYRGRGGRASGPGAPPDGGRSPVGNGGNGTNGATSGNGGNGSGRPVAPSAEPGTRTWREAGADGHGLAGGPVYPDPRDEVVQEYLLGMRELVAAQRDVLLNYLGAGAATGRTGPDGTRGTALANGYAALAAGEPRLALDGHAPYGRAPEAPGTAGASAEAPAAVGGEYGPRPSYPPADGTAGVPAGGSGGGRAPFDGAFTNGDPGRAAVTGLPLPGAEPWPTEPWPAEALRTEAVGGDMAAGHGDAGDSGAGRGTVPEEVMEVVLDIVHTRTGYPLDMLDPELDLEADLSIDSIKRVEIIGALADRIGLPRGGDTSGEDASGETAVEELARIKTLRGIVDWITRRTPGTGADTLPPGLTRLRVEPVEIASLDGAGGNGGAGLRGQVVAVRGDGHGVASALTGLLRAQGADVRPLPEDAESAEPAEPAMGLDGADVLVELSGLRDGGRPVLPAAFPVLRRALTGGVRRLLLVTGGGGRFGHGTGADPLPGAGLHGFARSVALEYPGVVVRAVDVDPKDQTERIAAHLVAELCTPGRTDGADGPEGPEAPVSVGYPADGRRLTLRAVPAPAARPPAAGMPLSAGSVVLLTGGARGITARTALALARATGCHVELVGRTPLPSSGPEPDNGADPYPQAGDRVALRAALIADGLRTPAEIEAAASRILAEREVRATLAALAGSAASVRYHCADVTDESAVRAVVADVRARHGRLDGIVHGAGILRDGLLRDKEPAAFAEVFTTKVAGARHLAAAAAEHGTGPAPAFLALFGSVAGVYGNRGQTDYAAANDALDTLAAAWSGSFPGRVLAVDWGPWAAGAGGMVTPELERAYARRGIPLIDPEAGVAAFLDELARPAGEADVQVVLMAPAAAPGGEGGGRD